MGQGTDFATIAPYTIEEAYEVADAIARGDLADLRDELGDLLLQVVYHARMAEEIGAFDFRDVVEAITDKLIRRHPHVFGEARDLTPEAVKGLWGKIKAAEKAERQAARQAAEALPHGAPPSPPPTGQADGFLDGVPLALPALSRAVKLQEGGDGRLRLEGAGPGAGQDPRGDRRDAGGAGQRRRCRHRGRDRRPAVRRGQSARRT